MSHNSRFTFAQLAITATVFVSSLTACRDDTAPVVAETATRTVAIAGYQQSVTVGTTGTDSLALVVYGSSGNVLPGATVQWTVDGGGTLSNASSVTDENGVARVAFSAGTMAGVAHVSATVGTAEPTMFEETLTADAPARLIAMQATEDTVAAGSALSGALLKVVDQYGNAVANVTISASEQSAVDGDVLTNSVLTTDASGEISDTFVPADVPGERVLVFTTDSGLTLSLLVDVIT